MNTNRRQFLSTLAVSGVLSTAGADFATADSWNQWRGPQRDGTVSKGTVWPSQLQGKLNSVWKREQSPSYSGPVIQDGVLITTETVDKKFERVIAYKLDTGDKLWERQWEGAMAVPFFAAANGDWIRSTPACHGAGVVVLGMRDVLVHLDLQTGEEIWKIDFPAQFSTPLQSFGAVCSPVIVDDAVYVQLGGGLTKVDLATGKVLWRALEGGADMMSSGAFSSPSIATIAGQEMLLVQTRNELCGVSLEDGQVFWKEPIEAFRGMNILTPLAIGDSVFTAAHSGSSQLFDITKTGDSWSVTQRWQQKTQGYMSSPVVIGDQVYLHMKNERAACLATADGNISWTSPPVGKYWSMVSQENKILSLSSDGQLRLIEATPESYQVIDEMKVADDSWAHLAMDGSLVIVRSLKALEVYRWEP